MEYAKMILENKTLPDDERVLAIEFLSLQNPQPYQESLKGLIQPTEPKPVQVAAIKTLSHIPDDMVAPFVLSQWSTLTPEIREEAITALMSNETRMKLLLGAIEEGTVQTSNLGWRRSVQLMNHSNESIKTKARLLINKDESKGEELLQKYQPALTSQGTFEKGRIIFDNNCASCHKMGEDMGGVFGPNLASLKNRRAENILSDILFPNLSIADGYDLWSIEMQNGEIIQGIIGSETPNAILLRIAGGTERNISRSDIKSLNVMDISAMPPGLEEAINPQQMADLLAFILKIKSNPK